MPKGWLLSGSPDCSIDRTFITTFNFPHKVMKANKIARIYRNPIHLSKEYKKMIDSGEVKNQAELARIKGISRARVTQILNLLKLNKDVMRQIEQIGDPMDKKVISERELRKIINQS